jgi:hypothetical protein
MHMVCANAANRCSTMKKGLKGKGDLGMGNISVSP